MVSNIKDMRSAYMIKEKVINNPKLLGVRVAKYLRVSRRCPNSKFQIRRLGPNCYIEVDPLPFLGLDLIDPRSSEHSESMKQALKEHEASTQRAIRLHHTLGA